MDPKAPVGRQTKTLEFHRQNGRRSHRSNTTAREGVRSTIVQWGADSATRAVMLMYVLNVARIILGTAITE